MSGDTCKTVKLVVDLQENGILRLASNGRLIGRLSEDEDVNFEKMAEKATETGDISDGYHTFNELYHHRAVLFSLVCNSYPEIAWKSKLHSDGTMFEGMFIVGIETPFGHATYHYNLDPYWDYFNVKELEMAPEWDGHTSADAVDRLLAWSKML